MGIGLAFEEYVDLRLRPSASVERVFQEAAAMEREQTFPMNTASAANHLRSRGYDCRPAMLEMLVENGVVTLSQPDTWTQADVDAAGEHSRDGHAMARTERRRLRRKPKDQWIVIEGVHEPLVSREDFDRALAEARRRAELGGKGCPTKRYLLPGLVKCLNCKYAFSGKRALIVTLRNARSQCYNVA
jgi:hypothetical protein